MKLPQKKSAPLLIIGAGGHAKVVLEALFAEKEYTAENIVLYDDNLALQGQTLYGCQIRVPIRQLLDTPNIANTAHIAIGDNKRRQFFTSLLAEKNKFYQPIIHPMAVIAQSAVIGSGCFIAALALISADAIIQEGCIINHAAIIDHECRVGRFCHVAPGACLGGKVSLGDGCFIGANATILPGISLGDRVTVGAGAVVTKNIAADITVVGIPAKQL